MKIALILLSVIVAVFAGKHDMKNDREMERMKKFEQELKRDSKQRQMNEKEVCFTYSHMNCMLTPYSSFFRIGTPNTELEL